MLLRRKYLTVIALAWTANGAALVAAEPADGTAGTPGINAKANTIQPPQVAYDMAISTRGINVGTAGHDALFGAVTLSCIEHGVAAVVGRDARNYVLFENVIKTAPTEDIGLRAYSRIFSELRRIAWNLCTPDHPVATGEKRTVEQKGAFALGSFKFPDQIKIQDQLGSIGCEAEAVDKMGKATPCTSNMPTQPFSSTLTRKTK